MVPSLVLSLGSSVTPSPSTAVSVCSVLELYSIGPAQFSIVTQASSFAHSSPPQVLLGSRWLLTRTSLFSVLRTRQPSVSSSLSPGTVSPRFWDLSSLVTPSSRPELRTTLIISNGLSWNFPFRLHDQPFVLYREASRVKQEVDASIDATPVSIWTQPHLIFGPSLNGSTSVLVSIASS